MSGHSIVFCSQEAKISLDTPFLQSCVKSVPLYYFGLVCVVLHMAVKKFFKHASKNGEIGRFNRSLLMKSF